MTDDPEIDVDALREELDQIKGAMGLQERYPTHFQLWLVYGLLAMLAAFGAQAVETLDLPAWGHWVAWGGFLVVGLLYERTLEDYESPASPETKPAVRLQTLGVVAYLVAITLIVGPLLDEVGDPVASATIFALIVGAIGTVYVVVGSSLAAYYVRARDRYAFYLGGAWMIAYAVAMARIPFLQEWGYAVFGALFGVYGVGVYVYLSRGDDLDADGGATSA